VEGVVCGLELGLGVRRLMIECWRVKTLVLGIAAETWGMEGAVFSRGLWLVCINALKELQADTL
jgi:hypothetical protein